MSYHLGTVLPSGLTDADIRSVMDQVFPPPPAKTQASDDVNKALPWLAGAAVIGLGYWLVTKK